MKKATIGLALAVAGALASPSILADEDRGKVAHAYDVCVDATTDARFTNFPPGPGDRVTAAGMMLPAGTVPSDGTGDPSCASYASKKVGTFFVNGTFVATFPPNPQKLPQAADDDLGYVDWHFRVNDRGAFDTSGLIKQFVLGRTYPQTITGGTGAFRNLKGEMITKILGGGGFQIRVFLPDND